jgi:hypothetical protein
MCVACAHVCYTQQDHLFTKATRNNSPFHARAWVREDMCTSHVCVTHSKIAFSSKQQHTIPPSLILCITHIVHHSSLILCTTHHSYCASLIFHLSLILCITHIPLITHIVHTHRQACRTPQQPFTRKCTLTHTGSSLHTHTHTYTYTYNTISTRQTLSHHRHLHSCALILKDLPPVKQRSDSRSTSSCNVPWQPTAPPSTSAREHGWLLQ